MATKKTTVDSIIAKQPFQEDFLFYYKNRWNVGYKFQEDVDSYSIRYYGDCASDTSVGLVYIYKDYPEEDQGFTIVRQLPKAPNGG